MVKNSMHYSIIYEVVNSQLSTCVNIRDLYDYMIFRVRHYSIPESIVIPDRIVIYYYKSIYFSYFLHILLLK